ncbi:hypothetical protein BC835DRAFT_1084025 [Cytidiella melzeri]|nr:hypothetical protein BC835DRAFT_1084025 [Cytidiella melzeri]
MLPRAATFSDVEVEEPLMESEAEGTGDKKGGAKVVQSALSEVVEKPQIIVEPSPAVSEDSAPVQEVEAHSEQDVTQTQEEAIPETLPSAGLAQETTREQLLATKTEEASEPPVPALDVEQLPSPPLEDEVDDTTPTSSSELLANLADSPSAQTITFPSSSTQSLSPVETPPNDISPPHSAPLSLNTEMGSSSGTEEIFGSSEELQTPSDSMSFQTAESPVDSKVVEDVFASDVGAAVLITEPPQTASAAVARTVLVPAPTRNDPIPATIPLPLVNIESPVDRPLDLPESPLTAKPTPASREFPPHTVVIPSPTPSSPSEKAMFERKNTQKSFHAVVHHKVVESSPVEPAPAMPAVRPLQNKANPIFPSQKKSAQRVVSQAYVEPESTSIGDLASLVADAALLEEALATPAKKPSRIPVRAQSGLPQVRESRSLERPRPAAVIRVDGVEDSAISPPGNSPFSDNRTAANSSSFFTSHLRANSSTGPKSTSPSGHSRGSKYFSGLRRKQSMPGAYPRTSSEMSTDESMLVSTPPSPPLYGYEGSDTSSIRSSSKSLKSPKKSLSRASSWLFRKSSSPSVAEEEERPLPPLPEPQSPSSSAMLSPNSAVEPRLGARPASICSHLHRPGDNALLEPTSTEKDQTTRHL